MRKIFVIFFLILFFSFWNAYQVIAQVTPSPSVAPGSGVALIPGITCGNATSESPEARKCCATQISYAESNKLTLPIVGVDIGADAATKAIDAVLNVIGQTPVVGGFIKSIGTFIYNIKDYALQLQRNIAPVPCPLGYPSTADQNDPQCTCLPAISPTPIQALKDVCAKYNFSNAGEKAECNACANAPGVWTGLGCVYGDTGEFLRKTVFGVAIGLAGIFALICIIYAAFTLQTSRGNPEKIKKAQELLTSCIMGLMLILFSVFILRLIGVNILKIPGFG